MKSRGLKQKIFCDCCGCHVTNSVFPRAAKGSYGQIDTAEDDELTCAALPELFGRITR